MERQALNDWEHAVDQSAETSMIADLPTEYPLGGHFYQEVPNALSRDWQRLDVVYGKPGARWAYRLTGEHQIVADTLFNGDASHFVGMLGVPHNGVKGPAWVLISPRMVPPPESKQYEEKPKERYERSREVYDVDSHTATKLP